MPSKGHRKRCVQQDNLCIQRMQHDSNCPSMEERKNGACNLARWRMYELSPEHEEAEERERKESNPVMSSKLGSLGWHVKTFISSPQFNGTKDEFK